MPRPVILFSGSWADLLRQADQRSVSAIASAGA